MILKNPDFDESWLWHRQASGPVHLAPSVVVTAPRAIGLTTGPFAQPPGRRTHTTDYADTQAPGVATRLAGLAAIRAPAALVPPPRPHSS